MKFKQSLKEEAKSFLVVATVMTIFILLSLGFLSWAGGLFIQDDYKCDPGEVNVTGDYKVEPDTFFNQRQCAIRDCGEFNHYQEHILGGEERCVV